MTGLDDYYFLDPRVDLLPIEQLTPRGLEASFAARLIRRRGWSRERVALFDAAFSRYWERTTDLAGRTQSWRPPRLRHVALVTDPDAVRPYVQLLNTGAWLLYESDLDPAISHPEFVAYLLAHGDRMAITGEVSLAAILNAGYWLGRSRDERAAFAAAADRSPRPDAEAFRLLATAIGSWLKDLRHEALLPPDPEIQYRSIPGTGLLVPRAIEREPEVLVARWTESAQAAVERFHARWKPSAGSTSARDALLDWLARDAPPCLITGDSERILWHPDRPERFDALCASLGSGGEAALHDIRLDLEVIARHTRTFHSCLVDPDALPAPSAAQGGTHTGVSHPTAPLQEAPTAPLMEQRGYAYLHPGSRLIAYNLHEPGMERLAGPALPYAREMLGARVAHEWAHLTVEAGWIPRTMSDLRFDDLQNRLAHELDAIVAAAPASVRDLTAGDLAQLVSWAGPELDVRRRTSGQALVRLFLTRIPDYQANLLAVRLMKRAEIETYVRHNIRTLPGSKPPAQVWRRLIRYLYELQYLGFSQVDDPKRFFLLSTWFDADFFSTGILAREGFDVLAELAGGICAAYAVDTTRFRGI